MTDDRLSRLLVLRMGTLNAFRAWASRPARRWMVAAAWVWVCALPAWLFNDALDNYYLFLDDWEYVTGSRTWERAFANLWNAHNVHVVPVWRLWSAAVIWAAGDLEHIPTAFAIAAYAMHIGVMILTGRLVARETGSEALALVAAVFVGTTSLMEESATWFSASQAAGAGLGIVLTLLFAQGWRQHGGVWRLVMVMASTWIAAGCWTTGHAAGPVAAAYLLADRRRRCVLASAVPLIGTMIAVAVALAMGAGGIEEHSTSSFHGRKAEEAVAPAQGIYHTIQSIPERLICGALGLKTETTFNQALILVAGLFALWGWTRRADPRPNPLECAGAMFVVLPYWMLWSFRGYLPFSSLRGFVPWYETIPQIGATLLLAGWWAGVQGGRDSPAIRPRALPTRSVLVAVLVFQVVLAKLNEPRVLALFCDPARIGVIAEKAKQRFPVPKMQRRRALFLWSEKAGRQRRHLVRLDHAERLARRMHVGRESLVQVFGRVIWPLTPPIDDANLLDLPWKGTETDPDVIRAAFAPAFALERPEIPALIGLERPAP